MISTWLYRKFIYEKGQAYLLYDHEQVFTRAILFKRVTTWIDDTVILASCVACQNIILKIYQTHLTITLIGNGVNLKAAFSKACIEK